MFLSELMDPPSAGSVAVSRQALRDIGAIGQDDQLTSLGWTLGQLPIDPQVMGVLNNTDTRITLFLSSAR